MHSDESMRVSSFCDNFSEFISLFLVEIAGSSFSVEHKHNSLEGK